MFNIATLKKGISNKKTIFWSRGLVKKMGETLGLVRLTLARKLQPLLYIIRYWNYFWFYPWKFWIIKLRNNVTKNSVSSWILDVCKYTDYRLRYLYKHYFHWIKWRLPLITHNPRTSNLRTTVCHKTTLKFQLVSSFMIGWNSSCRRSKFQFSWSLAHCCTKVRPCKS